MGSKEGMGLGPATQSSAENRVFSRRGQRPFPAPIYGTVSVETTNAYDRGIMRRRQFLGLLGGAAVSPLAVRAPQAETARRIGFLHALSENDPDVQETSAAFAQALRQLGWIDGRNIKIEWRWGGGDPMRIRKHAEELAGLNLDVVIVSGNASLGPMLQVAPNLPMVFVNVADPVGAGFVASLAHPGGNATGFMQFEYGLSSKWVDLLREVE